MKNSLVLKSVFSTLKNNLFLTVSLVLVVLGSIFFSLIPPLVIEKVINDLVLEKFEVFNSILYFLTLGLGCGFDMLREVLISFLGQKITRDLRLKLCDKISRLKASYFTKNESGKIASVFINDVEALDSLFKTGIISTFVDACKIVGILSVLFTKSLGIGLLMVVLTPFLIILTWKFKNKIKKEQTKNRRAIASINNHVHETIENFRTIKSLQKTEYFEQRFSTHIDESYNALKKTYFFESIYTPIINQLAVTVVCVSLVLSGLGGEMQAFFGIQVGTAVAIIDYVFNVFTPIESLGMEIQNIQTALAGVRRVDEYLLEEERDLQTPYDKFDFSEPALKMQDVNFSYVEGEKILDDLSLEIKSGESVTLMGRTGAGKTTIFKLILGLEVVSSGVLEVFGVPSKDILDSDKRKIFGYIEQSIKLVSGSVKDQITLGDNEITDEEVENACRLSGLLDTIKGFKNGFDEVCHERLFSQGQLQLLAVARAVVKNPKIMLLDEITANLDSKTEQMVVEAITNATKNRTLISICHRMNNKIAKTKTITIGKQN